MKIINDIPPIPKPIKDVCSSFTSKLFNSNKNNDMDTKLNKDICNTTNKEITKGCLQGVGILVVLAIIGFITIATIACAVTLGIRAAM